MRNSFVYPRNLRCILFYPITDWFSKLPDEIRKNVKPIVEAIVNDAELSGEKCSSVIKSFREIVPEYPKYHWRYLHPEIQRISKPYYEAKNYYTAFLEAAKHYINAVRAKSNSDITDERNMMENVFQIDSPKLSVTEGFRRPDGTEFQPDTIKNIKEGQKMFSVGVVVGGRHIVVHEEVNDLRESGLFREEDCLDALSLLSHLFYRLDKSTPIND